jgi:hypothetical protein
VLTITYFKQGRAGGILSAIGIAIAIIVTAYGIYLIYHKEYSNIDLDNILKLLLLMGIVLGIISIFFAKHIRTNSPKVTIC